MASENCLQEPKEVLNETISEPLAKYQLLEASALLS